MIALIFANTYIPSSAKLQILFDAVHFPPFPEILLTVLRMRPLSPISLIRLYSHWKHCLKFFEHLAKNVLYLGVILCTGYGLGIDHTRPQTLGKGSYTYSELVYLCVSSILLNFFLRSFILLCGFYIHPPQST
ncbi:hypothetical protein BDN70DRAFT_883894 [Pholiota conissans]|uniref:Uncharacterized protein n=1 Tax=Pholiota conissans TaxID=109636 RepID=A0A9P6CWI5_9AGAR|nr:hypothetical protein BDN70DRAFT_883894 [Pholiota conissans]